MLPTDPLQRVATRALRGDFGDLPDWKRSSYEWVVAREGAGATTTTARTAETAAARTTAPRVTLDPLGGMSAEQRERRRKCRKLWQTHAPWSYTPELADWLVSEHERLGIGPEWFYSMCYGMANFGLRTNATAPGQCYGPMDVKWPYASNPGRELLAGRSWRAERLRDPRINIRCHTAQMAAYHARTGRTGMALLRTVFYPASPYGRATNSWAPRWGQWERKFRRTLEGRG